MLDFNPFDCEFNDINEEKLELLIQKGVSESWFVEYKEFFITDTKKLAKSISSFANSEGGWYFIGIKSDSKTNVATEICGIDDSTVNDLADTLSKSITGNISPTPSFEIKIVSLNSSNKVVVVIKIEDGQDPPYMTSSGTIHIREHNASNPVTDRYIIEKMYEKSKKNKDKIERFCEIKYGETRGQSDSNQSYLELYFFPMPFDNFFFKNFFKQEFFDSIASAFFSGINFNLIKDEYQYSKELGFSFNSIYSSFDSLIIRPINDDSVIYKGITVELFRNGNIKILLPLYEFKLSKVPKEYKNSEVIEYLLNRFSPYVESITNTGSIYPWVSDDYKPIKSSSRKHSDFVEHFQLIDGHYDEPHLSYSQW